MTAKSAARYRPRAFCFFAADAASPNWFTDGTRCRPRRWISASTTRRKSMPTTWAHSMGKIPT